MKKFLYSLLALTAVTLVSCEDDTYNVKADDPDMIEGREHMALFLHDNNTGTSDYLKSSHVDEEIANKIWLSWTEIPGSAGYMQLSERAGTSRTLDGGHLSVS